MKRVIGVALALIVAGSTLALAGVDVFTAFKTGLGARALGMGGAFTGVGNDATAAFWNPAGLGLLEDGDIRLTGMSTQLFDLDETKLPLMYVGAVTKIADFGVGLAWERFGISVLGGVSEQAFIATLGTDLLGFGMVGANAKYYMAENNGISGSGFGFDLGLMLSVGDMLMVGFSASDLMGTNIAYDDQQTDVIASMYRIGVAVSLMEEMLTLAADMDFLGSELGDAHVGLEFRVIDELALRGGVVLQGFSEPYFAVGAGISVAGLFVDAAYLLDEKLGNTLVLSAEFSLGDLLGGGEEQPPVDDTTE
jgi:hypothetical protein